MGGARIGGARLPFEIDQELEDYVVHGNGDDKKNVLNERQAFLFPVCSIPISHMIQTMQCFANSNHSRTATVASLEHHPSAIQNADASTSVARSSPISTQGLSSPDRPVR